MYLRYVFYVVWSQCVFHLARQLQIHTYKHTPMEYDWASKPMRLATHRKWNTWRVTLQVCGGELLLLLHHHVMRQLFCGKEEGSAESGESFTADCGRKAIHHHGHIHLHRKQPPVSQRTPHTLHTHCLPPCNQAGGCSKSRTTKMRNSFYPEVGQTVAMLLPKTTTTSYNTDLHIAQ